MVGQRRARQSASDRAENACAQCCGKYCRCSPYATAVCWATCALIVVVLLLWIGGSFLVGPANSYTPGPDEVSACSAKKINIGFGNDAYAWYTMSSGIVVTLTIFATCLYCVSFLGMCCGGFPKSVKLVGLVGMIIALLAFVVYLSWIGVGTYLIVNLGPASSGQNTSNETTAATDSGGSVFSNLRVCINFGIYLLFFYIYLFVFVAFAIITVVWKCHDMSSSPKTRSKSRA